MIPKTKDSTLIRVISFVFNILLFNSMPMRTELRHRDTIHFSDIENFEFSTNFCFLLLLLCFYMSLHRTLILGKHLNGMSLTIYFSNRKNYDFDTNIGHLSNQLLSENKPYSSIQPLIFVP